jgi:hypothetical protein
MLKALNLFSTKKKVHIVLIRYNHDVTIFPQRLMIKQWTFCPHSAFTTVIIFLNSINRLAIVRENMGVYCEVENELMNTRIAQCKFSWRLNISKDRLEVSYFCSLSDLVRSSAFVSTIILKFQTNKHPHPPTTLPRQLRQVFPRPKTKQGTV